MKTIDLFGDTDEAQTVFTGTSDLTVADTGSDPLLPIGRMQIIGLACLNDHEMIFSDGFESL